MRWPSTGPSGSTTWWPARTPPTSRGGGPRSAGRFSRPDVWERRRADRVAAGSPHRNGGVRGRAGSLVPGRPSAQCLVGRTTVPRIRSAPREDFSMPRYLVERTFPDGLAIPTDDQGAKACLNVVDGNAVHGVSWVHSYVSPDRTATYCIYDGPSPDAIRAAARTNGLP